LYGPKLDRLGRGDHGDRNNQLNRGNRDGGGKRGTHLDNCYTNSDDESPNNDEKTVVSGGQSSPENNEAFRAKTGKTLKRDPLDVN
jgi:hypothetical protein